MEIESKFLVTEEADFQALESISGLASYALSEAKIQLIDDTFLDTENRSIMAAGYYLRVRKAQGENGSWITIKSLGGFKKGTHVREEYVSFLPEDTSVFLCPDFRIRKLIFKFTAGLDLFPLLSLKQKRMIRQVKKSEKIIAETYLDRVNLKSEGKEKSYNEFEVELKSEGTSQDLETIRNFLLKDYNLAESPFSKFERAFLFMENVSENTFLNLKERAFCRQLADQRNIYGKQAKILLAINEGKTFAELGSLLKIPETEIETLYSKYKKERLSIFPFTMDKDQDELFHLQFPNLALKKETQRVEAKKVDNKPIENKPTENETIENKPIENKTIKLKEWDPEELLDYYRADRCKAEKARENALILFDGLFVSHGMEQEERKLLGLAAFLKDIGNSVFPEEKTRMSKEVILTHSIKGLKLHEILILALIIKLQDQSVSEKDIVSTLKDSKSGLPPVFQNKALMLAAILKIADLFECKKEIRPEMIRELGNALEIEITGIRVEKAAKKAEKKSELWKSLFEKELLFTQVSENNKIIDETQLKTKKETWTNKELDGKMCRLPKKVTAEPADSMAWFAWKIFSFQFSCMLLHEKGAIKGEKIEELHDMRVAVRRMRAAAKVFEAYLDPTELELHLKGLKNMLGSLGKVRDLDVFREKAEGYLKILPSGHEHDLDPLFALIGEEREKARKKMLDYLDSEKYSLFKKDLSEALLSPETLILQATDKNCDALPHRIRDVLPSILYARMADINAYSEWVEGPFLPVRRLHRLRIAAKGMRYTLEFFEGVLGRDAKAMIAEFKSLQDHLGNLHDAVLAVDLLKSLLRTGKWNSVKNGKISGKEEFSENMDGIGAYLKYKEDELQMLLDTFPEAWEKIRNEDFRVKIESAVRGLDEVSL